MKNSSKRKFQQIASNNLSGIDFEDFVETLNGYAEELYSLLVNDTALSSDNPLWFRKSLL